MTKLSQNLTKVLNINWKLHCVYKPQSYGQEKGRIVLQEMLTKLVLEPEKNWINSLPFVLLRAWCTPYQERLTRFGVMFGRPCPILLKYWYNPQAAITNNSLIESLQTLWEICQTFDQIVKGTLPSPVLESTHQFQPGDFVGINNHYPDSRIFLEGTLPSYYHHHICYESNWCHYLDSSPPIKEGH